MTYRRLGLAYVPLCHGTWAPTGTSKWAPDDTHQYNIKWEGIQGVINFRICELKGVKIRNRKIAFKVIGNGMTSLF